VRGFNQHPDKSMVIASEVVDGACVYKPAQEERQTWVGSEVEGICWHEG
jgi:hypothetical protein